MVLCPGVSVPAAPLEEEDDDEEDEEDDEEDEEDEDEDVEEEDDDACEPDEDEDEPECADDEAPLLLLLEELPVSPDGSWVGSLEVTHPTPSNKMASITRMKMERSARPQRWRQRSLEKP